MSSIPKRVNEPELLYTPLVGNLLYKGLYNSSRQYKEKLQEPENQPKRLEEIAVHFLTGFQQGWDVSEKPTEAQPQVYWFLCLQLDCLVGWRWQKSENVSEATAGVNSPSPGGNQQSTLGLKPSG